MKTAVKDISEFIEFLKENHVTDIVEKSQVAVSKDHDLAHTGLTPDRIRDIAIQCMKELIQSLENGTIVSQEAASGLKDVSEEFCKVWIEEEQKKIISAYIIEFIAHSDEALQIMTELEKYYNNRLSSSLHLIHHAYTGLMLESQNNAKKIEKIEKESQHFAYAASHDLQEPLRMVTSYLQILSNRYKDKLDAEAVEFIGFALDGSSRMKNLINGLLEFSRLNNQIDLKKMNTNATLASVLENLSFHIKESNAEITCDDLPEITADPTLISKLFQHLISNAIKFKKDDPLKIDIHVEKLESDYRFSIKDNGIGIQKEYFDKIFIIFQRLHAKNKYPGTGIGLAVCKKIVEQHGGKMWVESEVNNGTTFYFTIPMEPVLTKKLALE